MKLRARILGLVGIALAAFGLAALYVWLAQGEIRESRYATYSEGRESQRRGWLPAMLPASATEIHEWHALDTNVRIGSFRFDQVERQTMVALLRPGARRAIRIDRDPSFASPLSRDPNEAQLQSAGFELYSAQDFDFAINWKLGLAYFWAPSS